MTWFRRGFYTRIDRIVGIDKVPDETVDYTLDWGYELRSGQVVVGATWSVPSGLTGGGEARTNTTTTKRFSGGGTPGTEYRVKCTMTKSNGETVPRVFVVRMVAEIS